MNSNTHNYITDQVSKGVLNYDDMNVTEQCELTAIMFQEASKTERFEWIVESDFIDNFMEYLGTALIRDNDDNRQSVINEAQGILNCSCGYKARTIFRNVVEDFEEEEQQKRTTRDYNLDLTFGHLA